MYVCTFSSTSCFVFVSGNISIIAWAIFSVSAFGCVLCILQRSLLNI